MPPLGDAPASPEPPGPALALQEQQRLARAAASRIWQHHRTYLYALSLRWLRGNRVEAEDAVADVIYKASVAMARSCHNIADERAWLTRVLHNRCMDTHRSRYGIQPLEAGSGQNDGSNAKPTGADRSAEEVLLNKELGEVMRQALAELPTMLRGPVTMRLLNDEPYTTISEMYSISQANARKRIQQAREILQRRLEAYLRGEDGRGALRPPAARKPRTTRGKD
jgi:RNA polymerase sigma factor (sigma-70 family)